MRRLGLTWLTARVGRVPLLTAALAVAAALATAAVAPLPQRSSPFTVPWWLLAALFCVAEICVVHVQFRREAQSFSLSEVPLVIGLFFDRPVTVVLAYLLGAAVALTLHRRQSRLKLAFNLSNFTLGAAVAVTLFAWLAPNDDPTGNVACLAAVAAVTVAGSIQTAIFVVAIFLSEGFIDRSGMATNFGLAMLGTVINTCLALIVVNVAWSHPQIVWLMVVPVAGVALSYRAYVSERENRQQVAFLYEFSRHLQHGGDLDQALLDVLKGSCETFRVEMAEIIIFPTRDGEVMVRTGVGAHGIDPMRPVDADPTEQRSSPGWSLPPPPSSTRTSSEDEAAALPGAGGDPRRDGRRPPRRDAAHRPDGGREPAGRGEHFRRRGPPPLRDARGPHR